MNVSYEEVEYYPLKRQALDALQLLNAGPTTRTDIVERTVLGFRFRRKLKGWRICPPSAAGKEIVLYRNRTFRIGQSHYDLKLRHLPEQGADEHMSALRELVVVLQLENILQY